MKYITQLGICSIENESSCPQDQKSRESIKIMVKNEIQKKDELSIFMLALQTLSIPYKYILFRSDYKSINKSVLRLLIPIDFSCF